MLAIDGMPGIGKTTLAVHLAHEFAAGYPDGQLYVDLRGYDGREPAMSPAEALRGFLGSLGVPQEGIPAELHACTAAASLVPYAILGEPDIRLALPSRLVTGVACTWRWKPRPRAAPWTR